MGWFRRRSKGHSTQQLQLKKPISAIDGTYAEQLACDYLLDQGLILVERNFHCRFGEIDIIMRNKCDLIFVEVRYRRSTSHGSAEESITPKKCKRLAATAQIYMQLHGHNENVSTRFDVVALSPSNDSHPSLNINWVKNITM